MIHPQVSTKLALNVTFQMTEYVTCCNGVPSYWDKANFTWYIWTPSSKYLHLTTFSNISVWFIHVLIFVTNSKCRKSSKSTNIVIKEKKKDFWCCHQRELWLLTQHLHMPYVGAWNMIPWIVRPHESEVPDSSWGGL